jgi:hypothetical protein
VVVGTGGGHPVNQHTWFGNFGLLIAPPGNWIFGIILIKVFLSINKENNYKLE